MLCLALIAQASPRPAAARAEPTASAPHRVSVVSFNIQFLGQFKIRKDAALADLLAPYDVVVVQELVAPPYAGSFPNGDPYNPDPEAARFFDEMAKRGFSYVLSPEDTGSGDQMHVNSSATEWFVVFYKPAAVQPAPDLVTGFLAEDRYNNPDFERVPYAFGFRAGSEDLVFISVHLQPGGGSKDKVRRAHEISTISAWIQGQTGGERDYVILGDMNIEDCGELAAVLPTGFASLNSGCLPTNTNPNGPKPYDHVMYSKADTAAEVAPEFRIIDLVAAMRPSWPLADGPYPGDPYRHDLFRQNYSDHKPVSFDLVVDDADDD